MSREKILQAVKKNKPQASPLPAIEDQSQQPENLRSAFIEGVQKLGANVIEVSGPIEINESVKKLYSEAEIIFSTIPGIINEGVDPRQKSDPHHFADVEVLLLEGEIGVAENGAIWISEKKMIHRILPFITQHLVIFLKTETIVPTMHQAYIKLQSFNQGYGVFIAGPSKTADIEQSLVIGAHGPLSLTVLLAD